MYVSHQLLNLQDTEFVFLERVVMMPHMAFGYIFVNQFGLE